MAVAPVMNLIEALSQVSWLDAGQKSELARLEAKFAKPRDLAQELVRRGWLTLFQANQFLQNKGNELTLGQYILLDKIGEGGMGQVYKARQRNLDRVVALKVIRPECLDNPKVLMRFQREIRAAGHLSHPNIVHAYDADHTGSTYFIAMEYIEGADVAQLVKDNGPLPVEQACEIIRQAALGLQHACERGLVHRDIKPANLLVSSGRSQESGVRSQESGVRSQEPGKGQSGVKRIGSGVKRSPKLPPSGVKDVSEARKILANGVSAGVAATSTSPQSPMVVKILDLGLARWDDSATGRASTHLTQMGSVMGTPDFIAPEQARNSHTCDMRADLYSLGCTLYYMLAGRIPFVGGSFAEKLLKHQMDEAEPIAPLRRGVLSLHLSQQGKTKIPRKLLVVPEEVDAIVKKLMAKRPEDRYQTPLELATLLEQVLARLAKSDGMKPSEATEVEPAEPLPAAIPIDTLADEPLIKVAAAHGLSRRPSPRTRQWLIFGSIAATVFLCLTLASLNGNNAKPRASEVELKPEAVEDAAWKALQSELKQKKLGAGEIRAKLLDYKRQRPDKARAVAQLLQKVASPFDAFDRTKLDTKLWFAWMPDEIVGILGPPRFGPFARPARSVAVSADGRWIVAPADDKAFRVWDTGAPNMPWRVDLPGVNRVSKVAIASDSNLLAVAADDGMVRLYDLAGRKLVHTLDKHKRPVSGVAFHPTEPLLATAGFDGVIRLWDTAKGTQRAEVPAGASRVLSLAFSADGAYVAWGGDNHEVRWATSGGRVAPHWSFTANTAWVTALAFSPDGRSLICGGGDGTLRLCSFDGQTMKEKSLLREHGKVVHDAAYSPDGQSFASVSDDMKLILWDAATGAVRKSWELKAPILAVAFAPDSRHLVVGNANGSLFAFRSAESVAVAQAR